MKFKNLTLILTFTLSVFALTLFNMAGSAHGSDFTDAYIKTYDSNDEKALYDMVKEDLNLVRGEIKTLIYTSMSKNTPDEKKEGLLFTAEQIAITYKEVTGDFEPIREVKREQFERLLRKETRPTAKDGVHIIETPPKNEQRHNFFSPENLVIKKGETVRWHNTDIVTHLFASFSIIGKGGLFTPSIEPGSTWEYTFTEPGEYYYLCFIHKGMVGKITVEE